MKNLPYPKELIAGQIWIDEDGDYSIILEVFDEHVKILVMSGKRIGFIYDAESKSNFMGFAKDFLGQPYFQRCLQ